MPASGIFFLLATCWFWVLRWSFCDVPPEFTFSMSRRKRALERPLIGFSNVFCGNKLTPVLASGNWFLEDNPNHLLRHKQIAVNSTDEDEFCYWSQMCRFCDFSWLIFHLANFKIRNPFRQHLKFRMEPTISESLVLAGG